MYSEVPDVQAGFRKGRGAIDQISNICWIIDTAREFQKNPNFYFIDYAKPFILWITTNNTKLLKRWEYQTTLLSSWTICAGQEATVRIWHWTSDWFQIGKRVCQGCILSPCLFNLYAEYIMQNSQLDEAQAGIKIAGRNSNNLRQMIPPLWQKAKKN